MALPTKAWVPNTHHHPISLINHGPLTDVKEVIIHVNDGTTNGTLEWWNTPGHEADGAHLQISKNGQSFQTAPLNAECWHCPPMNHLTVGVEHEGWSRAEIAHRNDSRPHVQLHASANRVAWILHECKLGRPDIDHNIKSHSAYPEGGHPNCPGPWPWEEYEELCHTAYMNHWGR